MNILHMQLSGGFGGIATLSREINKYSQDTNIFVFLFEGGCVADEIKATGTPVYTLNVSHSDLRRAKREYFNICKRHKVDVVVSHTGCFMEYQVLLYLKKHFPLVKVFMYEHCDMTDAMGSGWKGIINRVLYKKCFSIAQGGIAISNYVKKTALTLTPGEDDKIKVIYNGVNLDKFQYVRRERKEYLRLVYIGRVIPEKGCDLLIQALSQIPENVKVQAVFVGNGTDIDKCKKMASELKIKDKVSFVGQSNRVRDYLNDSDVFVHPARGAEGFGITLVEAMATGLPCVAFERGAIPELISDGKEGLLAKGVTAGELAKMISVMYENLQNGSIERMSRNAAAKAQLFDIKATVHELHKLYEGGEML